MRDYLDEPSDETWPLDAAKATFVVTGAGGFVGNHLSRYLSRRFSEARVLSAGRAPDSDIPFDLADPGSAANIVKVRPDVVIHLAGESTISGAEKGGIDTWRHNFVGTMGLADALAAYDRPYTLLFASSAEVYGRAFAEGVPVTEQCPPQPMSVYGRCKFASEMMLRDAVGANATLVVARPSNHVGSGQAARFALPSFARQIVAGERHGRSATIRVGNLDAERDFLDVRDVVSAYGSLIAKLHGSGDRSTFNVSSGMVRSVRSMLEMLIANADIACEIEIDDSLLRPVEIPRACISPALIEKRVGWRPNHAIEQTVRGILNDARQAF